MLHPKACAPSALKGRVQSGQSFESRNDLSDKQSKQRKQLLPFQFNSRRTFVIGSLDYLNHLLWIKQVWNMWRATVLFCWSDTERPVNTIHGRLRVRTINSWTERPWNWTDLPCRFQPEQQIEGQKGSTVYGEVQTFGKFHVHKLWACEVCGIHSAPDIERVSLTCRFVCVCDVGLYFNNKASQNA